MIKPEISLPDHPEFSRLSPLLISLSELLIEQRDLEKWINDGTTLDGGYRVSKLELVEEYIALWLIEFHASSAQIIGDLGSQLEEEHKRGKQA